MGAKFSGKSTRKKDRRHFVEILEEIYCFIKIIKFFITGS